MRAASLLPQRSSSPMVLRTVHTPARCTGLGPVPLLLTRQPSSTPAQRHHHAPSPSQLSANTAPTSGTPGRQIACSAAASAGATPSPEGGKGQPVVLTPLEQQLAAFCASFTRLFPLWVILAAVSGFYAPQLYLWFDSTCVTYGLMFVMAGMGLTLTLNEIISVFTKQPQLLLLGMVLQYTVLPIFGYFISRYLMAQPGLAPGLAVGVALVSCMPGGTASNIVAYIAKGDMPLSIMMTTASTLMAIATTPLLTSLLVGTLVPVDPRAMFLSVLQLVLAPVLAGTAVNQFFPSAVARVKLYTPFLATVVVYFIVGGCRGRGSNPWSWSLSPYHPPTYQASRPTTGITWSVARCIKDGTPPSLVRFLFLCSGRSSSLQCTVAS
ncbi:hypothetical protein PLESTF_001431700 [Pleodorina starrii]|nr:hypothetical protein PLESTF_001431700 [Pleodorina starrii]